MSKLRSKAVETARRLVAARTADVVRAVRDRRDEGQDSVEYVGVIVLVAAIIAALVGSGVADDIAAGLSSQVQEILNTGGGGE
ncbi:hypothetical protein [Streptomyces clavuligerus]|nr:hypothetical protein [Streptomyces clavuligerus]ANW18381.1 hypothetical protein BB341_09130 [Streptomyces clavuligerus]AXU12936.1 hypothetical protein D1794_09460 [Streptomyces clavuligerus]MBY6302863.1 hypothetical protein [Streptomyces clavuligerus]QCS05720.1 hypothetical protein CRV15_08890 [Streptomyces clavuligerus]QPJ94913.1 hypothetical protein GE265_19045 [Streptomyces clavuligerus]